MGPTTVRSSRSPTRRASRTRTWLGAQGAAGTVNLNLTQDLSKEAFNSGETPFIITGPWNVADAQAKGIDIAIDPIPTAGGEVARPFVGVQGFYLSAKSENTLAANEFLVNYMAREDVQTALYEAGRPSPGAEGRVREGAVGPDHQGIR